MKAWSFWKLIRFCATFMVLAAFWVLFSADIGLFSVLAGVFSSVLIALSAYDVFIEDYEASRRAVFPRLLPLLLYPFILTVAMYRSSLGILRSILSGRVSPHVVHFRSRLRSDLARVVLAESITFTPGTIVIDLDDDHYVVHWLNATSRHSAVAGAAIKGGLEAALKRIWA